MKKFKIINFDNFDFDKIEHEMYEEDINDLNNFSYWYPKVKDCGIKMADTKIYKFDFDTWLNFHKLEDKEYHNMCIEYLKSLAKNDEWFKYHGYFNIKNGTFSDKFDAVNSMTNIADFPYKFCNIQYSSQCYSAGGSSELVVRDIIPYDKTITPTIYNGLPFRTEFRVFVDFDNNKVLYVVNYWDYDYCYPKLLNITDKVIFDYMKDKIENDYNENKGYVSKLVQDKLIKYNSSQENKLNGYWSVDILKQDDDYYLIDMAIACQSAYWNPDSLNFTH